MHITIFTIQCDFKPIITQFRKDFYRFSLFFVLHFLMKFFSFSFLFFDFFFFRFVETLCLLIILLYFSTDIDHSLDLTLPISEYKAETTALRFTFFAYKFVGGCSFYVSIFAKNILDTQSNRENTLAE